MRTVVNAYQLTLSSGIHFIGRAGIFFNSC